jgi:hypothetical protein
VSALDLAPFVFPTGGADVVDTAASVAANVPLPVTYTYAAHRILSEDGFYFKA